MFEDRKDKCVAILYGGIAPERGGSMLSGQTVFNALIDAGYKNVTKIDVKEDIVDKLKEESPEVAYLALHGGFGEDGSLQGLLEIMNIPYTSSGVAASSISMNKALFKRFVSALGYNTPAYRVIERGDDLNLNENDYPLIIKPVDQGCSYGVSLVNDHLDLKENVEFAFKFSDKVILEKYITGKEIAVGIIDIPKQGSHLKLEPFVLPFIETECLKGIFDYETKYPGGEHLFRTIIPARLSDEETSELEKISLDIYKSLGCKGYSMMDAIYSNGTFFLLENNTIPGMLNVEESYIPRMLKQANISITNFVDFMVLSALDANSRKIIKPPSEEEVVKYLGLKLAE